MRAAAHIREYGGTLEHFWIEAVKDRTDAEYLDAREIPASLVTELAADPNGAVLRAANGRPAQLYVIVPVDGTLRISFGAGAELEKAARPGWLRISVWMLPRGDLTRSSGLLSQNGADGKAHGTESAGACQNCIHGQPLLRAEVQIHWFLPGEAFLRQNAAQRIERKYDTGANLIAILSRVVSAAYGSDASSV